MPSIDGLMHRLQDSRSKKVVFLSHCLLNENTRYLGGACCGGCVRKVIEPLIQSAVGLVQMPCPEQQVWGGVLKRMLLAFIGAKGTLLYRFRRLLFPLFVWYTRYRYRRLALAVARQIDDYVRSGFAVIAIVGVDGSPSCGVNRTLNPREAFEQIASVDAASITVDDMNTIVRTCQSNGAGLFTRELQKRVQRRHGIEYRAYDLIAELDDFYASLRAGRTSSLPETTVQLSNRTESP